MKYFKVVQTKLESVSNTEVKAVVRGFDAVEDTLHVFFPRAEWESVQAWVEIANNCEGLLSRDQTTYVVCFELEDE